MGLEERQEGGEGEEEDRFVEEEPQPVVNSEDFLYDTDEEEELNESLAKLGVKKGRKY